MIISSKPSQSLPCQPQAHCLHWADAVNQRHNTDAGWRIHTNDMTSRDAA